MRDDQHYEGTINCSCGRTFIVWTKNEEIDCAVCGKAFDVTKHCIAVNDNPEEPTQEEAK